MQKVVMTICSALIVGALLTPTLGLAQGTVNEFGLYTDPLGSPESAHYDATKLVPFDVYLVLTNPINSAFADDVNTKVPITAIDGYELAMHMEGIDEELLLVRETFPELHINVGIRPDWIVGFGFPVPVTDGTVVLLTLRFLTLEVNVYNIYMGAGPFAHFPGHMAIVDSNDPDNDPAERVYPSSGNFDLPVFSINGADAVAIEEESWGSVKALFR